jgi:hypothetical protein
MTTDIIAIIAILTLAIVVLGIVFLPYLAAINHVTYDVNQSLITGAIAALSGIISACAVKKLKSPSDPPAIQDQTKKPDV